MGPLVIIQRSMQIIFVCTKVISLFKSKPISVKFLNHRCGWNAVLPVEILMVICWGTEAHNQKGLKSDWFVVLEFVYVVDHPQTDVHGPSSMSQFINVGRLRLHSRISINWKNARCLLIQEKLTLRMLRVQNFERFRQERGYGAPQW